MKKLITGAIVAAALAVPATPAFAIHDPNVPAGTDSGLLGRTGCSHPGAQSVGDPAPLAGRTDKPVTSLVHSNEVLIAHNNATPACHNDPIPN